VTFSSRVPLQLEHNRLAVALARLRRDGVAIVDLTGSNPTRAGFEYPADLLAPLGDPRGLRYHPEPLGLLEARAAVAADFARRGQSIDPSRIALTASTSEAYSLLFKVLCDPGDEVLVPQPSYPLFEHLTRLDGVEARPYQLEYHGRWSIDVASIERGLTPRTRAVLLVNPNNPTGNYVKSDELDRIARLCAQRQLALISDEVFDDYALDGHPGPRAALCERRDVLGFTLGGLSKSIGLPQAKLGWIAVSGSDTIVDTALPRLEFACDTYLSVSTPVQLAAAALLERGAGVRRQIQSRLRANLATCAALVAGVPACTLLHAEAGWSAVIQVPTLAPEEELMLTLLQESSVLVHPGYFFDFARESFLIVSLLTPEPAFAEGLGRVVARFAPDGRS
jgi:aspartate/methionine/tyrosine aminotransferase